MPSPVGGTVGWGTGPDRGTDLGGCGTAEDDRDADALEAGAVGDPGPPSTDVPRPVPTTTRTPAATSPTTSVRLRGDGGPGAPKLRESHSPGASGGCGTSGGSDITAPPEAGNSPPRW